MQPGEEIGGNAIGEAEDELENLASLPATPAIARAFRWAWGCMFAHYGAQVIYRREVEGGSPVRITTQAFKRELRDKDFVEGVVVSDKALLINPAPLEAQGLEWPPRQGDKVIVNPGKPTEAMFTAVNNPHTEEVCGVNIVTRMVARGVE